MALPEAVTPAENLSEGRNIFRIFSNDPSDVTATPSQPESTGEPLAQTEALEAASVSLTADNTTEQPEEPTGAPALIEAVQPKLATREDVYAATQLAGTPTPREKDLRKLYLTVVANDNLNKLEGIDRENSLQTIKDLAAKEGALEEYKGADHPEFDTRLQDALDIYNVAHLFPTTAAEVTAEAVVESTPENTFHHTFTKNADHISQLIVDNQMQPADFTLRLGFVPHDSRRGGTAIKPTFIRALKPEEILTIRASIDNALAFAQSKGMQHITTVKTSLMRPALFSRKVTADTTIEGLNDHYNSLSVTGVTVEGRVPFRRQKQATDTQISDQAA